jgi:hypothetical protein
MDPLTLEALTSPLSTFLAAVNLAPTPQGIGRMANVDFYYHTISRRWCCVRYCGSHVTGMATYLRQLCIITLPPGVDVPWLDEVKLAQSGSKRLWLVDADDLPQLREERNGDRISVLAETE